MNIFTAVKYCCILHGRVCVMPCQKPETVFLTARLKLLTYIGVWNPDMKPDQIPNVRHEYLSSCLVRTLVSEPVQDNRSDIVCGRGIGRPWPKKKQVID